MKRKGLIVLGLTAVMTSAMGLTALAGVRSDGMAGNWKSTLMAGGGRTATAHGLQMDGSGWTEMMMEGRSATILMKMATYGPILLHLMAIPWMPTGPGL